MKFKAKMDIDITAQDLFEEQVREAIHAYTKNVSRNEINQMIDDDVKQIISTKTKELFTEQRFGETKVQRMVPDIVRSCLREAISTESFKEFVLQNANEYLHSESFMNSVQEMVKSSVKASVSGIINKFTQTL